LSRPTYRRQPRLQRLAPVVPVLRAPDPAPLLVPVDRAAVAAVLPALPAGPRVRVVKAVAGEGVAHHRSRRAA